MSESMEKAPIDSPEEEEKMNVEWPDAFDYEDPGTGIAMRFRNRQEFIKWQEERKN